MASLSLIDLMYFFVIGQVILIVILILFIRDKRPKKSYKNDLDKELEDITLPPIEGIIYPGQHSERYEA
jgi:hypothetical protein